MKENTYYFAGKLLAAGVTAALLYETADTGILVIRVLVLCCLFLLQQLFRAGRGARAWHRTAVRVCQVLSLILCFGFGAEEYLLELAAVGLELLDEFVGGILFYEIGGVCLALLWFLYQPDEEILLLALVFIACFLLLRHAEGRRAFLWENCLEQREKLAGLQEKLSDMQTYTRTLQDAVAAEERSRFAARIHDKLGHSISGSIILLEAAALTVEKNPREARKSIESVADNLREGVDDIRAALRQERPRRERLGIQELRRTLEEFRIAYGRQTDIFVEGNTETVSAAVWVCIQENLKEALTNMLKHSSGCRFTLRIQVLDAAVRVEYADDGSCGSDIAPGLGLQAIEERTAACGGRCMFSGGQGGFRIVTVWSVRSTSKPVR